MTKPSVNQSAPDVWDIGLSAWIIQDGNYPDFCVGQTAEFAVEFWFPADASIQASSGDLSTKSLGEAIYDVVAKVAVSTAKIEVLDIGFLAYRQPFSEAQSLPEEGSRIAVRIGLGVDPYFYFEALGKSADVLPLVYTWRVLSILKQTAPFMNVGTDARQILTRDPDRRGYEEIAKTDAWNDDGGHGDYILRCELISTPPKRTSVTALA